MAYIFYAPSKYIQGRNTLSELGRYLSSFGHKALIVGTELGLKCIRDAAPSCDQCELIYENFNGECSMSEINRLQAVYQTSACDILVGAGGGKVLDTVKAAACFLKAPCVVIPTAVTTDAPTSALSVIYNDDGTLDQRLTLPKSPDLILVDSQVIADAPAKLLVAGMGDAMSTYFEARACHASNSCNVHGGTATRAAMILAEECYRTILENGAKAKAAVSRHLCTPAVEAVIEANTLLSGIGFEGGGKAAAHPIGDGLNTIPQCKSMHGEKVAFGSLVQLFMENAYEDELDEAYSFCATVGLPVTLEQLSITDNPEDAALQIAEVATQKDKPIYNMPCTVTEKSVRDAILAADLYGQAFMKPNE
ncbi:MAG: glycerol dehydrogenase [Lachnospiraceae bacterium]|jgi:glycerol dehydrogenase|nr:glycerol dehydrogenase [Lachnospiraceae bacterium]MCI1329225.1 glycerol dehydrogenase [Lachnospiraceae bacterium]